MFETLKHIDRIVFLAINGAHHPILDAVMWQVSAGWIFFPLWIFLFWYIFKQKGIRFLAIAVLCIGFVILFCDQSANLFKHGVKRYRPTHNLEIQDKVHVVNGYRGGQHGFFSGHSSNTTGVAVFLFLLLTAFKNRYRFLIFLWPVLVGYSRMYLGVHYPGDILFGALNGLLWGVIFYRIFDYIHKKRNEATA